MPMISGLLFSAPFSKLTQFFV